MCRCDCGYIKKIFSTHVLTGRTKSCGCYRLEVKTIHGNATPTVGISRTYNSWRSTKARCYQKKQPYYFNYGGRGIKMCDRWKNSFENFLADMGKRPPGKFLDRIDVDKDYKPGNCKWVTRAESSSNERRYNRNYRQRLAGMRSLTLKKS